MADSLDLSDIGMRAYTIAALAKAAFALLHTHDKSETDEELVSVKLNLIAIAEKATEFGDQISEVI